MMGKRQRTVSSIQVLVATMHQHDFSLLKKMNIQTDAIICNQCSQNQYRRVSYNGNDIQWLDFDERGLAVSRNHALMRASADVCLIADDDMIYDDGYKNTVISSFNQNPLADIIIFNIKEKSNKRDFTSKAHYTKNNDYGSVRIAFRREMIQKRGLFFNIIFGAGALYSHGEDTIFLSDCIKNKFRILAVPNEFATLTEERKSTWFNGYNDKFFLDNGALYAAMKVSFPYLRAFRAAIMYNIKLKKESRVISIYHIYKQITKGMNHYHNLDPNTATRN